MLERLYNQWGLSDETDFAARRPVDYPVLADLYRVLEQGVCDYDREEHPLYPKEVLQEVLLGLRSMCLGAESKFFNGPTNISSHRFLVFGVKGLLQAGSNVRNAMLFNVLAFLSDKLLTEGNTVATLDELYIWLSNLTMLPSTMRANHPHIHMMVWSDNPKEGFLTRDGIAAMRSKLTKHHLP